MARFEETPGLFGKGIGGSTIGPITCELCGTKYHQDNEDVNGEIIDLDAESVAFVSFAGIEICDCCFDKVEKEILCRMMDILPWFSRILESRKKLNDKYVDLLKTVVDKITS